jgi:hypothetical protein
MISLPAIIFLHWYLVKIEICHISVKSSVYIIELSLDDIHWLNSGNMH